MLLYHFRRINLPLILRPTLFWHNLVNAAKMSKSLNKTDKTYNLGSTQCRDKVFSIFMIIKNWIIG